MKSLALSCALAAPTYAQGGPPDARWGRELPRLCGLDLGPCMDVYVSDDWAFIIGQGTLYTARLDDPAAPRVVGRLTGLGSVRQLVCGRGHAFITSRLDGLFIVDISDPAQPRLRAHYDTIEWATGVALAGDVLFVACRIFGVELIDVSDPGKPTHLSTVRTGEAQSVAVSDGFLYTGVWGSSELVVVEVRNPRKPKIVALAPLDGYGDGVALQGRLCAVATGHHSRSTPRAKVGDPGYGTGHGLEFFDVSDPTKPVWISRVKFPPLFGQTYDMWSVTLAGSFALVADTHNGAFVVDLKEPQTPRVVAQRRLPFVEAKRLYSHAAGLTLRKGFLYVAGGLDDLNVLDARGVMGERLSADPEALSSNRLLVPALLKKGQAEDVYQPGGQVYAVALLNSNEVLVAAGQEGIHRVKLRPGLTGYQVCATEGFAFDVKVKAELVFTAEGRRGLGIWAESRGQLQRLARYETSGATVRQVILPPPGDYAILHVGNGIHIVDVREPTQPRCVLQDTKPGPFYGDQIIDGLIGGHYAAAFWIASGLFWYDLYGGPQPVAAGGTAQLRLDFHDGVAAWGEQLLAIYRGGYLLLNRGSSPSAEKLFRIGVEGLNLSGKPGIQGSTLWVANRATGVITILDISRVEKPVLRASFQVDGNPGRILLHEGRLIIPAGYEGLMIRTIEVQEGKD